MYPKKWCATDRMSSPMPTHKKTLLCKLSGKYWYRYKNNLLLINDEKSETGIESNWKPVKITWAVRAVDLAAGLELECSVANSLSPIGSACVPRLAGWPISCEQRPSNTLRFSANWREPLLCPTGVEELRARGCGDFSSAWLVPPDNRCGDATWRVIEEGGGGGLGWALTGRFGELPMLNRINILSEWEQWEELIPLSFFKLVLKS